MSHIIFALGSGGNFIFQLPMCTELQNGVKLASCNNLYTSIHVRVALVVLCQVETDVVSSFQTAATALLHYVWVVYEILFRLRCI